MPRVRVEWIVGRSDQQRDELARRITTAFVDAIGIGAEEVSIVFDESPATHYYRAGVQWQELRVLKRGSAG